MEPCERMAKQRRLYPGDYLSVVLLLLLALLTFLLMTGTHGSHGSDLEIVDADGHVVRTISLAEDSDTPLTSVNGFHLTVSIRNGTAFVSDADCPNGDCMAAKPISSPGQVIICAPARLLFRIAGTGTAEGGADTDAFAG